MISSSPLPDNTQHSQQRDIHAPGGILRELEETICFLILQNQNIPNLLLKSVIEIYPGNKIKPKKTIGFRKNIKLITEAD
jgi:hypothetical protein